MEKELDAPEVLETPAETAEAKIVRLEQEKGELESKNKQLFERVKKTEEKVAEVPLGNLNPKDAVLLAKADIDSDDIDEVLAFADYRKIPISDALKNSTLQTILKTRVEERKTAAATTVNPAGRQAPRETPESILEMASQGQVSDTDAGIEELASARLQAKIAKRKK